MHEEQSRSQIGTDLNSNLDSNGGGAGSSDHPCDEVYHGASVASEPETYNLQDLAKDIFEDERGSNPSDPAPPATRATPLLSALARTAPEFDERLGLSALALQWCASNVAVLLESDESAELVDAIRQAVEAGQP